MAIKIYNTYSRKKEEYTPLHPDVTGFYTCGPTVYDYFHIGNARAFIVFDMIRRYFIYRGYRVRYVMNLTDIDDKIIKRANEQGVDSAEIAEKYAAAFFEDIQKLGIRPADVYPRATDHIEEIQALIAKLIEKGVAYESGGDVFYDVAKFPAYASLSGKNLDQLQSGARIAVDERKHNPLDFVLWKAAKPGEPKWPSPWGEGRPGWHIECSAMSMRYLGETFDIHAGGQDLIFPHHENEIAQSSAATGKEFARYWLHNGFLDIRGEKMSKSLGNFITVRELTKQYSAAVVRLFFMQKHYRSPVDFTEEGLQAARASSRRLTEAWRKITAAAGDALPWASVDEAGSAKAFVETVFRLQREIQTAMDDDFNTPAAVGKLFDLVREANRFIDSGVSSEEERRAAATVLAHLEGYDSFLGVIDRSAGDVDSERVGKVLDTILQMRSQLRQEKNFALADRIRDELAASGVIIEDSPEGPKWRWKN